MSKPHPLPTYTDRYGRICDEFGPLDPTQDSLRQIFAELTDTVKDTKNKLKEEIKAATWRKN